MNTPIRSIGQFYKKDQEGHLINPASWDKVPESWHKAIQFIKNAYLEFYGKDLLSLYLRGSIVRGTFVSGKSDIDVVGLVSKTVGRWEQIPFLEEVQVRFEEMFPMNSSLELMVSEHSEDLMLHYPTLAMVLKTQGLCIYGVDILPEIPPFKADERLCFHYKWLEKDLLSYWRNENSEYVDRQGVMKLIMRTGFELVIKRSNLYTLDLYPAVQTFGQYYPTWKDVMEEVLYFYLNPRENESRQDQIIHKLGKFLIQEVQIRLM